MASTSPTSFRMSTPLGAGSGSGGRSRNSMGSQSANTIVSSRSGTRGLVPAALGGRASNNGGMSRYTPYAARRDAIVSPDDAAYATIVNHSNAGGASNCAVEGRTERIDHTERLTP